MVNIKKISDSRYVSMVGVERKIIIVENIFQ